MLWYLLSAALFGFGGVALPQTAEASAAKPALKVAKWSSAGSAVRWVVDHGEGRIQETPLQTAARRYRLQIYETYRSNRSEYERRRVPGRICKTDSL